MLAHPVYEIARPGGNKLPGFHPEKYISHSISAFKAITIIWLINGHSPNHNPDTNHTRRASMKILFPSTDEKGIAGGDGSSRR